MVAAFENFNFGAQNNQWSTLRKNRETILCSFVSQVDLLLLNLKLSLLLKLKMVYPCRYCDSSLSTASNRTRLEHHLHPDELGLPTYQSSLCKFTSQKISNLEQHMSTEHSRFTNCCRSCHLGFNDSHLFALHMNSVHSLPVFGDEFESRDTPMESAFNGLLRTFETTDADEARDNPKSIAS